MQDSATQGAAEFSPRGSSTVSEERLLSQPRPTARRNAAIFGVALVGVVTAFGLARRNVQMEEVE